MSANISTKYQLIVLTTIQLRDALHTQEFKIPVAYNACYKFDDDVVMVAVLPQSVEHGMRCSRVHI